MNQSKAQPRSDSIHDGRRELFPETHWSVILQAGAGPLSKEGMAALEKLCGLYWYPLYAFVRRSGWDHEDARDFVQDFMLKLIERQILTTVCREKGRFRTFLVAVMKNLLCDRARTAATAARGGGRHVHVQLPRPRPC